MTFDFQICPSKTWRLLHIFKGDHTYLETMHHQVTLNFHLLSSVLKVWPSRWNVCSGHCLAIKNVNSYIFSRHINLQWDLCTVGLVFSILTIDLVIMTVTFENIVQLRNYKWQLLYVFRAYQNDLCIVETFWPFSLKLWTMTLNSVHPNRVWDST